MDRIKISMPLKSLLPLGLGIVSIWGFFALYNVIGYLICPAWTFTAQAPANIGSIRTFYNDVLFIETETKELLCSTLTDWQPCKLPSDPWGGADAPEWLKRTFDIIPGNQVPVIQVVRVDVFLKPYYFALLADDQILGCSTDLSTNLDGVFFSGAFLILAIPLITGLLATAWWFKIFIEEGSPTIWDWWGRGTKIK